MPGRSIAVLLALASSASIAGVVDPLSRIRDQQVPPAFQLDTGVPVLPDRDVATIRQQQEGVNRLLQGCVAPADLQQGERVELNAALQRINALVVGTRKADENRRVCKLERALGSNVRKQTCRTELEWAIAREESRTWHGASRICTPPGCGDAPGTAWRSPASDKA